MVQHPFASGFTLSEFRAVSTDGNWMESFIQDSLHGVHKVGFSFSYLSACS